MKSLIGSLFALVWLLTQVAIAQVNHTPVWSNEGKTLTYNLDDIDGFPTGSYGYCKWGNVQDKSDPLDIFNTDLFYTPRTSSPPENDLFLAGDSNFILQGYLFPSNAIWNTLARYVYLPGVSTPVRLYRYLHFQNTLLNAADGQALTGDETRLIILFHGWNPESDRDSFATGTEFPSLIDELKRATSGTEWKIALYHWEADSDTGAIFPNGAVNGAEAAEIGHQHGHHLGELLVRSFPKLKKVHLIAHSAGSWAARGTLRHLNQETGQVTTQLTLLDPFMPNAISLISSVLGKLIMDNLNGAQREATLVRLENYFAVDIALGTQETFLWSPSDINQQVDWVGPSEQSNIYHVYYQSHAGPIQFYADTLRYARDSNYRPPSLVNFDLRPGASTPVGWNGSLFLNEPVFTTHPSGQTAVEGSSITLSANATTRRASLSGGTYNPVLKWQWYRNGTAIPGATSPTYTIARTSTSDAGTYTVSVAATSTPGNTSESSPAVVDIAPIPTTPTSTTASRSSTTRITVTWAASISATSYDVYRTIGSDPGSATKINGAPVITTSYEDTTAAADTSYNYFIKAVNANGTSAFSTAASGLRMSPMRLVNISARGAVAGPQGNGNNTFGGFIISGGAARVFVQGAGPRLRPNPPAPLTNFNVPDYITTPRIDIWKGNTGPVELIARNERWGTQTLTNLIPLPSVALLTMVRSAVAGYDYESGSADAASLINVTPGPYTMELCSASSAVGTGVLGFWIDTTIANEGSFTNVSARGVVKPGAGGNLTAGTVISGSSSYRARIVAIGLGPWLDGKVPGSLTTPRLTVRSLSGVVHADNTGWSTAGNSAEIQTNLATVGSGISLDPTKADSAVLVDLAPGAYTFEVSTAGSTSGVALVGLWMVSQSPAP